MKSSSCSSLIICGNDEKIYYNTTRANLLHNFLEKYYRFAVVSNVDCLISDIRMRCPFEVVFNKDSSTLIVKLNENENISFVFEFEIREIKSNNYTYTRYYLKDIV